MRWIKVRNRAAAATLVFAGFAAIAMTDLATGADVTLRALYLLPICAAAWTLSAPIAIALSALGVAVALYVDIVEHVARLHPAFIYSDAVVRLIVYLAATFVLRALRDAQARLAELAQTDPLTRINNRRGFERLARIELQRAERLGTALTMAVIDLDGFKALNDAHGHAEGDRILAAVGAVLARGRSSDTAARLGGDEFAVLFAHPRSEDATRAVARVVRELDHAVAERDAGIRFSVGAATYHRPPASLEEMIATADALMYEAKRHARGGVRYEIVVSPDEPAVGEPA